MTDFKKAMMWTAISMVVLGVISVFLPWVWFAFGAVVVAAIIAAIVYGIRHQGDIAKGIWAGLGIAVGVAIIAGSVTCFVALSML